MSASSHSALWGLLRLKERWGRSGRAWLTLLLAAGAAVAGAVFGLHPFLAVNAPVPAEALVMEGWISDIGLEAAAKQFRAQGYATLYVTGGPLAKGSYLIEHKTFAGLGAATLRKCGVDSDRVVEVTAPETHGNRTYHSARALRRYIDTHRLRPQGINILTEGAHERRSRWLFQRALGRETQVGVISVPDPDYDPRRWWAYSEGLKSVVSPKRGNT